jgi:hypothetical protein
MNPVDPEVAGRDLLKAILHQAIHDYVSLRELGVIRGEEVEESFWMRRGNRAYAKPLNFQSPGLVRELVAFFRSRALEVLCDHTGHRACRVRRAIGMTPGDPRPITRKDLEELNFLNR